MPKSYNEQLAHQAAVHAIDLVRFSASERLRVLAYLRQLEVQLEELLRSYNVTGGSQLTRAMRYEALLAQVRASIQDSYGRMADAHVEGMGSLASAESKIAASSIRVAAIGAEIELNVLSAGQVRALASNVLIDGAPSRSWWGQQAGDLLTRFSAEIKEGYALGETIDELVRRIRGRATGARNIYELNGRERVFVEFRGGILDTSTRYAETLVRTSVAAISADARRSTFEENQDVVKGVVQISTLDSRTTVTCVAYSNKAWSLPNYEPLGHELPYNGGVPRHFNCVLADCLVSPGGRISAASERRFEGDLVVVRTAGCRELPCTPNHPILTARGWVAASALRIGDHVICDARSQRGGTIDGDHQQMPARIQDVARSFLGSRGVIAMPVPMTAEDFHGDARQGEVAVVGTDRFLRNRMQAAAAKHRQQLSLRFRGAAVAASLEGRRHLALLLERARSAAHGVMAGLHLPQFLLAGGVGPAGAFLFSPVARLQTARSERVSDRSDASPKAPRESGYADALREESCYAVRVDRSPARPTRDAMFAKSPVDDFVADSETALQFARLRSGAVETRDFSRVDGREGTANGDASSFQMQADGRGTDAQLARDLRAGLAGAVELDEVVELGSREWLGHVYNLETAMHHYVANGILTHNCRSTEAPLLRSWQELGIDLQDAPAGTRWSRLDGKVPGNFTFDDFFKRRTAAQVEEQLGKRAAELYRSGQLKLEDLVNSANSMPLTVAELEARASA